MVEDATVIDKLEDLFALQFAHIQALHYKPSGRNQAKVQVGIRLALKFQAAINYIEHLNNTTNNGNMMSEADLQSTATDADFVVWHMAERVKKVNAPIPPPPGMTMTTMMHTIDPVDAFKKGVKVSNATRLCSPSSVVNNSSKAGLLISRPKEMRKAWKTSSTRIIT